MKTDRRTVLKVMALSGAAAVASPSPGEARERRVAPDDARAVLFDSTLCVGCQSCVAACSRSSGIEPDPGERYVDARDLSPGSRTAVRFVGNGHGVSFVKRQCMHCIDPACVSACMLGAMSKGEHGIVSWNADLCVGCRYCQVACPFGVPRFEWNEAFPSIVKCEMCRDRVSEGMGPACAEVCPRAAITFGSYEEIVAEARRRVEWDPDRYNPRVYGLVDGGGTQVLCLAPASMSFEELGLPDIGTESPAQRAEALQHGIYRGFAVPAILYAFLGAAVWRSRRSGEDPDREAEEHPT